MEKVFAKERQSTWIQYGEERATDVLQRGLHWTMLAPNSNDEGVICEYAISSLGLKDLNIQLSIEMNGVLEAIYLHTTIAEDMKEAAKAQLRTTDPTSLIGKKWNFYQRPEFEVDDSQGKYGDRPTDERVHSQPYSGSRRCVAAAKTQGTKCAPLPFLAPRNTFRVPYKNDNDNMPPGTLNDPHDTHHD
eukprot:GHVU01142253.1.p2 GENE.GHVU01142253.1~~GHVU01142253.1.p2  ORF type:complete len:189 (+),score=19.30 GHVU01142253.1:745-1311(+)